MKGTFIVAIDAGYANFAWVGIRDGNWAFPERWTKQRLITKYTEEKLFEGTMKWCRANKEMLDDATAIVLERQIEKPFAVQNAIIRALYFDKTHVVAPATIAKQFGLPRTRKEKKKESILLVKRMGCRIPGMRKQDDLADAMLLAVKFMCDQNPDEFIGWRSARCLSQ